MHKIALSVNYKYKDKNPNKGALGEAWSNVNVTVDELKDYLSSGVPICVASLKNTNRVEDEFQSSQIIGLDFDNGPDVSYFSETNPFTSRYGSIIYSTANSKPESPRTRVLLVLDQPITNSHEYKAVVEHILKQFQSYGIDPVCKSAVQVFFGNSKGDFVVKEAGLVSAESIKSRVKMEQPLHEKSNTADILLNPSSNGSRNNDAVALVSKYANVMRYDDIEAIMRLWHNALPDTSGFPFSDVQTIIKHYTKKSESVVKAIESSVKTLVRDDKNAEVPKDEIKKMYTPFYSFNGTSKVEWMIRDWLPQATTAMMVAPPQHFKTWISLSMAMSLGMNQPLFGEFEVIKPCRVLVMQQEDARGITATRSSLIADELGKHLPPPRMVGDTIHCGFIVPNVDYYTSDITFTFANELAMRNLKALIKDRQYGLVIIDPLYAATDSSDYMAKDAAKMVELKRIRDSIGTSFLVLHHTKKAATTTIPGQAAPKANRQDAWGSQFLNAWQETGFQIRGTDDPKSVAVTRYFKSSAEQHTGVFTFDISTEDNPHYKVTNVQSGANKKVDTIKLFSEKGAMSVTTYASLAGVTVSTASRHLNKLLEKGVLSRRGDQTYELSNEDA